MFVFMCTRFHKEFLRIKERLIIIFVLAERIVRSGNTEWWAISTAVPLSSRLAWSQDRIPPKGCFIRVV
jgi:hypothetical protein